MGRALGVALVLAACATAPREDLVGELLDEEVVPNWRQYSALLAYGRLEPPPDDGPLEDLIEFWTLHDPPSPVLRVAGAAPEPSPATRCRLWEACQVERHLVGRLRRLLPDTDEAEALARDWLERHGPDGAAEEWLASTQGSRALRATDLRALAAGEDAGLVVDALTVLLHRTEIEPERARLRARLRAIVEDRTRRLHARAVAFRVLVSQEWEGRDAWCVSLLEDETLPGLLGPLWVADPNHWVRIVAPFVDHENRTIHNNAVAFLLHLEKSSFFGVLFGEWMELPVTSLDWDHAKALRPLLPWLEDPEWASIGGRARLVFLLGFVDLPEGLPALMRILESDEDDAIVQAAVAALASLGDRRAIPALKKLLRKGEFNDWVLPALLECGGIPRREQLDAIEAYVRVQHRRGGTVVAEWRLEEQIGYWALDHGAADDAFNAALLRRARDVPELAEIVHGRGGAVADRDIVRRLREGRLTYSSLQTALDRREEVVEHAVPGLRETLRAAGAPRGFAAALLDEPSDVLAGHDRAAQRALLAAARYMRSPLPIDRIARLLPDRAAELYLLSEDSPQARKHFPGRIHGFEPWEAVDQNARALLDAEPAVREIRALYSRGPGGEVGRVVLVSEERMELRWFGPSARVRVRDLTADEGRRLVAFLDRHRVDDLGPLGRYRDGEVAHYYLHLTREGGRRVFLDNPGRDRGLYAVLVRKFERLTEKGEFAVR